jgi:hypothetical protein
VDRRLWYLLSRQAGSLPHLLALAELLEVLLRVLALVAGEVHVFQSVGVFGQRALNRFLDLFLRLAGDVVAARIAYSDRFAGLRVGVDLRVVEALVRLFLGPFALALSGT